MEYNKIITDELVTERLTKGGWIEGCDDEHARNQVLAYYDCEISDQWKNPDFSIYEESTADGYSVWVAAADTRSVNINEDVYYYDSDLSDVLFEAIPDYNNIYCDCEDIVEDVITRHYEELLDKMEEDIRFELLDEGYTDRIEHPLNSIQWLEMIAQDYQFNRLSEDYVGLLNVDTSEGYKYKRFAQEVRQDLKRFQFVTDHYGIKIQRASASEMIFVLADTIESPFLL